MNIYELIARHCLACPEKTALVDQDQRISYRDFLSQVDALAQGLLDRLVKPGTRIALCCPNDQNFALVLVAAAKIGAAVAPFPLTLKGEALASALHAADCRFAIAWAPVARQLLDAGHLTAERVVTIGEPIGEAAVLADLLATMPREMPREDGSPAAADLDYIICLTSGSTGAPKPIIFTQETKIRRAFTATIEYYGLTDADRILIATPLYHSLAQRSLLMSLMLGATAVILPKFSVRGWLTAASDHDITFAFSVSSQLRALLPALEAQSVALPGLKHLVSSSASISAKEKQRLVRALPCDLHECYGASEVGVVTDFCISGQNAPLACVGRPLPGVRLKICDSNRQALDTGKTGEIACLTPTRFKAYSGMPEATAAVFDEDGYFYTGDMGYVDASGYLYFVERRKDIIKSGGISVFPGDIESVLQALPEVRECAAVAVPDSSLGEVIGVAYALHEDVDDFDENRLKMQALRQLTDYQQPRYYRRFTALPKTELGKVLKPRIREEMGL